MNENVSTLRVFTGSAQSAHAASGELCDRIKALVYEYGGKLPVSAAIGVLEIAKMEIMEEQKNT